MIKKILFVCDPPVAKTGLNVGGTHAVVGCLRDEFQKTGIGVQMVCGDIFGEVPRGTSPFNYLERRLDSLEFDAIHIVTQGRLGLMARRYCTVRGLAFTTAYHTQIPEYLEVRHGVPAWIGYQYMRWFLNGAERVIVPTPAMANRLVVNGVKNVVPCLHGVDTERFRPAESTDRDFLGLPRPIFLFVGRVTEEKNPEAFLSLDLPGSKVVVGDGYMREALEAKYPDVHFAGVQTGAQLARYYSAADVFVFPSRTDTFGLVLLEALSAGLPVAAFPVTGPVDVVTDPQVGRLDEDLGKAAREALELSKDKCREYALHHSWPQAAGRFFSHQVPCRVSGRTRRCSASRSWFEGNLNLSAALLERLVGKTEEILFKAEPAGPYSAAQAKNKAPGSSAGAPHPTA